MSMHQPIVQLLLFLANSTSHAQATDSTPVRSVTFTLSGRKGMVANYDCQAADKRGEGVALGQQRQMRTT